MRFDDLTKQPVPTRTPKVDTTPAPLFADAPVPPYRVGSVEGFGGHHFPCRVYPHGPGDLLSTEEQALHTYVAWLENEVVRLRAVEASTATAPDCAPVATVADAPTPEDVMGSKSPARVAAEAILKESPGLILQRRADCSSTRRADRVQDEPFRPSSG